MAHSLLPKKEKLNLIEENEDNDDDDDDDVVDEIKFLTLILSRQRIKMCDEKMLIKSK